MFSECVNDLNLDLVGQEGKDLLCGGAEDRPTGVGGIWEGHSLTQALQHSMAY